MIGDRVARTVCGLWVVEGCDLTDTSNFSWSTTVIDEPEDEENRIAEEFIRLELMTQVGQRLITEAYVTPTGVEFAGQHAGYVEREQYYLPGGQRDLLSFSDPAVPGELIEREESFGPDDMQTFTVCGRMLNLGGTVCWSTIASNPLMAYYVVWDRMQKRTGDHMLLCAVHPGDIPTV